MAARLDTEASYSIKVLGPPRSVLCFRDLVLSVPSNPNQNRHNFEGTFLSITISQTQTFLTYTILSLNINYTGYH
jgi:hypothetical protein